MYNVNNYLCKARVSFISFSYFNGFSNFLSYLYLICFYLIVYIWVITWKQKVQCIHICISWSLPIHFAKEGELLLENKDASLGVSSHSSPSHVVIHLLYRHKCQMDTVSGGGMKHAGMRGRQIMTTRTKWIIWETLVTVIVHAIDILTSGIMTYHEHITVSRFSAQRRCFGRHCDLKLQNKTNDTWVTI